MTHARLRIRAKRSARGPVRARTGSTASTGSGIVTRVWGGLPLMTTFAALPDLPCEWHEAARGEYSPRVSKLIGLPATLPNRLRPTSVILSSVPGPGSIPTSASIESRSCLDLSAHTAEEGMLAPRPPLSVRWCTDRGNRSDRRATHR